MYIDLENIGKNVGELRIAYTNLVSPFGVELSPKVIQNWAYARFYAIAKKFERTPFLPVEKLPTPEEVKAMDPTLVRRLVENLGTRITPIEHELMDPLTPKQQREAASAYEERFGSLI